MRRPTTRWRLGVREYGWADPRKPAMSSSACPNGSHRRRLTPTSGEAPAANAGASTDKGASRSAGGIWHRDRSRSLVRLRPKPHHNLAPITGGRILDKRTGFPRAHVTPIETCRTRPVLPNQLDTVRVGRAIPGSGASARWKSSIPTATFLCCLSGVWSATAGGMTRRSVGGSTSPGTSRQSRSRIAPRARVYCPACARREFGDSAGRSSVLFAAPARPY